MKKKICIITGKDADYHHVRSRGAFGCDEAWNLVPLCREKHTEIHKIGILTFSKKYPEFRNWLIKNGWVFDEVLKKWRHE